MESEEEYEHAGQQTQSSRIQYGAERELIQGKNHRKNGGKQAKQQESQDMLLQIAEKEGTSGFVFHTDYLLIL